MMSGDAVGFAAEPVAGAPEAGDHLVGDQQDVVPRQMRCTSAQ
jgi:hypothetical protein